VLDREYVAAKFWNEDVVVISELLETNVVTKLEGMATRAFVSVVEVVVENPSTWFDDFAELFDVEVSKVGFETNSADDD
jgi:hypothetical protein